MKKVVAMLLTAAMALGLMACAGPGGSKDGGSGGSDMSKYPAELEAWSGQDFIDYFTDAGIFTEGGEAESWLQDHTNYWPGTPVNECAGWWDEMSMVMIMVLSDENADTSSEDLEEWKTAIKDTKTLPGEYSGVVTVDHLVGNVAFSYNTIMDEELYEKMDAAYNALVEALGATPEF